MNRSPLAVKVRPVWRRVSFRLRMHPAAYVPLPEPVALPEIMPGAEGEAALPKPPNPRSGALSTAGITDQAVT
jgi:hypothetical protein